MTDLVCARCRSAVPRLPSGEPSPRCPGCGCFVLGSQAAGLISIHAGAELLDELEEDPDRRPYVWDLPED